MTNRAASSSIRGYLYQFLVAIDTLVDAADTDTVTLEGIEDIDIVGCESATAIQCKYLESTKFYPSRIKHPITQMMLHYAAHSESALNYTLFAHFSVNSHEFEDAVSLSFLQDLAQNVAEDSPIRMLTNSQIVVFLDRLTLKQGPSFEIYKSNVCQKIGKWLGCSIADVELFYFDKAIALISIISAQKVLEDRRITRAKFGTVIRKKDLLFSLWLHEYRGHIESLRHTKRVLSSALVGANTKRCYLFIPSAIANARDSDIDKFIVELARQSSPLRKPYNTSLWTIIIDAPPDRMNEIKRFLLNEKLHYLDGYEHIAFDIEYFLSMPIINCSPRGQIITKSSHMINLISFSTFYAHMASMAG